MYRIALVPVTPATLVHLFVRDRVCLISIACWRRRERAREVKGGRGRDGVSEGGRKWELAREGEGERERTPAKKRANHTHTLTHPLVMFSFILLREHILGANHTYSLTHPPSHTLTHSPTHTPTPTNVHTHTHKNKY